jgi:5-methylcytosine-specific restriction endonuclease McrA
MTSRIRTYSELIQLETFEQRFAYLSIRGEVGCATFGGNRWINQQFYTSREWRLLRHDVIARDEGRDLGVEGYEIYDRIIVHHMNPIDEEDILHGTPRALDLENLICTTHDTHNAIHYGDARLLPKPHIPRRPGDTKLW